MGNVASIRQENSSDLLLDQIEKQALIATTPRRMDCVTHYCSNALSTPAVLLMSNFTVSLKEPTKAPVLVDSACQTENDSYSELTINCSWQSCCVNTKYNTDEDSHSCTTEATDLFTDVETDEVFVVLSGVGEVIFLDSGERLDLGPGTMVRLHAGERTEWRVSETIRKVYVAG